MTKERTVRVSPSHLSLEGSSQIQARWNSHLLMICLQYVLLGFPEAALDPALCEALFFSCLLTWRAIFSEKFLLSCRQLNSAALNKRTANNY